MADANSSYTLGDISRLKELDDLELMMVEQPLAFDDFREHALLQAQMTTPICLDESITSPGSARLALELGSGKIINIKPGRVGGFGASREIHDLCYYLRRFIQYFQLLQRLIRRKACFT